MLMNLNAVMSIIANVPAAIASTVCGVFPHMSFCPLTTSHQIVACRVVRRLTNYTTEGAEVFGYVFGTDAFNFIYTYTSRGLQHNGSLHFGLPQKRPVQSRWHVVCQREEARRRTCPGMLA